MARRPAPIECDVFHIDILVASSCGGIQCESSRAQGGKPLPWKMLFRTSSTPKRMMSVCGATPMSIPRIDGAKPNAKLASAQSSRPSDM